MSRDQKRVQGVLESFEQPITPVLRTVPASPAKGFTFSPGQRVYPSTTNLYNLICEEPRAFDSGKELGGWVGLGYL